MKKFNNVRRHKTEDVKIWINKLTTDKYCLDLLQKYNGDELDKMTLREIEMLLNYIKAVYHFAYQSACKDRSKLS